MSRWEKFKKFLKNPGIWLLFFYAVFAAALAGSICLMALNMSENPLAYALYAISAILLGYCIYASVGPCRRLVYSVIHSNKLTERLVRDYGFRTAAFLGVSLAINAGYAVLQGVLGIIMHSYWYGLFAGYYIVLSVMRGVVLWQDVRSDRREDRARAKLKTFLACGGMLIILSVAFASLAGYLIISDRPSNYGVYGAIMMAAYTFYKITVSAINAVKVKKFGDYGLQSLRNINFADALVSIFALQMAMVATFGGADDGGMYILNIFVGAFVFIATFALGIFMIVRAATRLNKLPPAKREQMSEGAAETADMPAGEEK